MAYRTLAELVEAGRQAIAAERAAADAWVKNTPQRQAQAAAAFVDYMKRQLDIILDPDDTPVVAYQFSNGPQDTARYTIRIVLPGMASYVETQIAIDANGLTRTSDWMPVAQDNPGQIVDNLTDALLWLTAGEPLVMAAMEEPA